MLVALFSLTLPKVVVFFFRLLNRQFNKGSKNVLKTIIFLLRVGFKSDFVPDCPVQISDHNLKYFQYLLHQTSFSLN